MSKFCEANVKTVVEKNKNVFKPDSDAVIQAFDALRNNDINTLHSYDPINDQENEDIHSQLEQSNVEDETFNEYIPSHLSSTQSHQASAISRYIRASE